ncbi:RHS repeat domain-containing protein [Cysteiniphilum marinum]|uniref:RHS repeat domain-containing protein n=4 Tax=Cysteiniphilum marinum TaxID=2774191 RepID=UPI00193C16BA|nr:RHS repeat-associated core domain-containing protein [Cysteiniphilum marinum]
MKKTIVQLLISLLLITNTWQNVALAASLPVVSSHHPMAIIDSINNTDSATTTYRYNDLDQLTSVQNPHDWSAREQTYSQDGDLITAADGKEYTFNGQDQLVEVKLKNGKTINYQYYPNGLRSDRIIKNGEHVRFYYDQSGHVLATENVTATEKIKHSFFLSGLGKDMATVAEYNTQNNQDSYYVHQNGDTVMMLAHAVGNGVLKSGGLEVMGNQHYDAYGNPKSLGDSYLAQAFKFAHLENSNQDKNVNNSNSLNTNAANNFTYKGEYQDVDSNIVYLKARDYDPASARFLSRDSYDVWNHYSYADSDPVNKIDPSGHSAMHLYGILQFVGSFMPVIGEIEMGADLVQKISKATQEKGGLSAGAITGIVVGAVALISLISYGVYKKYLGSRSLANSVVDVPRPTNRHFQISSNRKIYINLHLRQEENTFTALASKLKGELDNMSNEELKNMFKNNKQSLKFDFNQYKNAFSSMGMASGRGMQRLTFKYRFYEALRNVLEDVSVADPIDDIYEFLTDENQIDLFANYYFEISNTNNSDAMYQTARDFGFFRE